MVGIRVNPVVAAMIDLALARAEAADMTARLDVVADAMQEELRGEADELLLTLLTSDRTVTEVTVDPGRGSVTVTVGGTQVRLATDSPGQGQALAEQHEIGAVRFAMGTWLPDDRLVLGFRGTSDDVLLVATTMRPVD
jgi:hypothetical protein